MGVYALHTLYFVWSVEKKIYQTELRQQLSASRLITRAPAARERASTADCTVHLSFVRRLRTRFSISYCYENIGMQIRNQQL